MSDLFGGVVDERRPEELVAHALGVEPPEALDHVGDEAGPAGLVARTETCAAVAVEVFVEEDQIAPVWIRLELAIRAVHGPGTLLVAEEDADDALHDLPRHLEECHPDARSRRTVDREVVTVESVQREEGPHEEHVHGEPDRTAPVRIASEETAAGLGGFVVDAVDRTIHAEGVRVFAVESRERPYAERAQELALVEH